MGMKVKVSEVQHSVENQLHFISQSSQSTTKTALCGDFKVQCVGSSGT